MRLCFIGNLAAMGLTDIHASHRSNFCESFVQGAFVVFDVGDRDSFDQVSANWML